MAEKLSCGGLFVDEVQSDWNENDENSSAYVKNRICYEEIKEGILADNVSVEIDYNSRQGEIELVADLIIGETYTIKIEGTKGTGICKLNVDGCPYVQFSGEVAGATITKSGSNGKYYLLFSMYGTHYVTLTGKIKNIKKIDSEYLPSQVQSDWNENDSTSPAFIMNKPDSLGGGVTWFSISFTTSSWEGYDSNIKKGETWSSGASTTSEELLDAFKNGLVRAHITDKSSGAVDWFGTLDGVYHYTSCGYTNDVFTFTVNDSKSAKISYTKS